MDNAGGGSDSLPAYALSGCLRVLRASGFPVCGVQVGHGDQLDALLPAQFAPEFDGGPVILSHEKMPLLDAVLEQVVNAAVDQHAPQSPAPVGSPHDQVIDVTAPAIGSAQNRADKLLSIPGYEAQTGVLFQEPGDAAVRIARAQFNPFRLEPQGSDFFIIIQGHLLYDDIHGIHLFRLAGSLLLSYINSASVATMDCVESNRSPQAVKPVETGS